MARPKVAGRNMPTPKKAKGITLNEDAAASKGKATKLPNTGGKGKGKGKAPASSEDSSDSDDIYSRHLITFENDIEHQDQQNVASEDDELIATQRVELRSRRMNDPSRIRTPQTTNSPPPVPAQAVVLAPLVQGPPSKSMNRLKTEGLREIIEEIHLSTDGMIDMYPEIMSCLKSHNFQIFTKSRGRYIPNFVREFDASYRTLIPQRKKQAATFKPILDCPDDIDVECQHLIRTKTLDNMKKWLVSLISDGTPKWLEAGTPIEKKDLNVAARYWFGFVSSTIMQSENELILRHAKVACLGCIIDGMRMNVGMIIAHEMVMRAKQCHTSFAFSVLIIELCRWARVLRDAKKDVEVISTSSTDIRRIEDEYLKDQARKMKAALVDSTSVVETGSLPAEISLPTPAHRPSGTSCVVSFDIPSDSPTARPLRPVAITATWTLQT
uniref:Putative plant transposon protein domain-containing protein n=1 Tax=Solanum tuberosum TaxID=4113 RepID=M1D886_SOLTU